MSTTLGIIIGNRDFFPDHLITEARNEILSIFKNKKINPILLGDNDTNRGGVGTFLEAQKCANRLWRPSHACEYLRWGGRNARRSVAGCTVRRGRREWSQSHSSGRVWRRSVWRWSSGGRSWRVSSALRR